jgi:hypothetical protein
MEDPLFECARILGLRDTVLVLLHAIVLACPPGLTQL